MFKRILLICMFGISLTGLIATDAISAITWKSTGWYRGSLCADTLWAGLGNCDDKECAYYEVTIETLEASCQCCNNGGQCGGLGNPFIADDVTIEGEDAVDVDDFVGKGQYLSTICWEDKYISDILAEGAPDDYCDQNLNWGPGNCILTHFNATIDGYMIDADGPFLKISIKQECTLPDGANIYDCKTLSITKY